MKIIKLIVHLTIIILFFLLTRVTESYEQNLIGNDQIPLIIDICNLYRASSVIFLYDQSIKEMEITTVMFKWTRALSREGFMSTNFYFSELHKSFYYVNKIVRPLYVPFISNFNAINEFSLATSTFDMSFAVWLVIFTYSGHVPDYCHDPPFNIFHLRFDSKMIVRCNEESILREWYSIDNNQTEIDDVALWNLENGITTIVSNTLYERRKNLKGMIMRVSIIKNAILIKVKKDGKLDGLCGRLFEELCLALNFTYKIVSEMDENGMWSKEEHKWTGVIGEINSKRADICPAGFSMTNSRSNVVDFTLPFLISRSYFYVKKSEKFYFKWSSFFLTFTYSIWISMLGILIIVSILLIFLKINTGNDRKIVFILSDNFLEIWGIFCQQGLTGFPNNWSLRLAYFSVFILIVVLWAAYSATLISFLTNTNNVLPFRSLEEIVNDGSYQLYLLRGSRNYDMFLNWKGPLASKIKKLMIEEKKLSPIVLVGFNTICKNRKITLYSSEILKNSVNSEIPCNVVTIRAGHVDSVGMILSKNNPYTDVINHQLLKFMNSGILYRLKDDSFKIEHNDKKKFKSVAITSVISLFFFIIIFSVLSICVLVLEVCVFDRNKKKKKELIIVRSYISHKIKEKDGNRSNIIK